MQLKSLLCFASIVIVAFGATIEDVLRGLDTVDNLTAIIDKDVSAFPGSGGSAADALPIFIAAANAKSAIDATTIAAKTLLKISPADVTKLLASVHRFFPLVEDVLVQAVAKRSTAHLGTSVLTLQMIKDFGASTSALGDALRPLFPPELQAQAGAAKAELDAAFAKAAAAYIPVRKLGTL